MSISSLLNISGDAMVSNQLAINITGANIANVNTPGYTRQRADFNAVSNVDVASGKADFGVNVTNVERLYNSYLEMQIVDQSQNVQYNQVRKDILGQVESIFTEGNSGGLNDVLGKFWNAWESLSTNPGGPVARESLVSLAGNLASLFRDYNSSLNNIRQNIQTGIDDSVREINATTAEIAQLNEKITAMTGDPGSANAIMDKRKELIKKLGENININFTEGADGSVSAFLSNGLPLVEGGMTKSLQVTHAGAIVFQDNPSAVITDTIRGGKLAGLIGMRDQTIKGYQDKLDLLANGIVDAVNGQHRVGFDAYGNAGGDFFVPGGGAKNMQISPAIAADLKMIASSSLNTAVNGENARLLANLKDSLAMSGGTATFSDYYGSLVGQVGQDVSQAKQSLEHDGQVMDQLQSQREAVSGVSLDEEMMNLMKFQFGYNAAGRLTKAASDMLDVLMNLGK